jgi:hypothetical protein
MIKSCTISTCGSSVGVCVVNFDSQTPVRHGDQCEKAISGFEIAREKGRIILLAVTNGAPTSSGMKSWFPSQEEVRTLLLFLGNYAQMG